MSLEALLGDRVVRLELNAHVVVLGGDHVRFLSPAELAVEFGFGCEPTAHFYKVILTYLLEKVKVDTFVRVNASRPGKSTPSLNGESRSTSFSSSGTYAHQSH